MPAQNEMSSKSGNQPPNVTNSVVRSTASSDSFSDDNNLNKQARIELIGLQRRYRVLEDQRHGFTQEGGCTARKQLWMVQLLKDEKEDIISNLRNANCSLYKRKAKKAEATILEFIKRYETYKIHIEDHLRNIKELSDEGDKIQAQVVHQKLKILTLYGQQISRSGSERRIKIRENKLYHITSKFDEQCKGNEYLREQISFFLRARTAFHKRHNYLKREIANEKNKMLQLVTHAEFTYDNRDEAVAKIKILRERDSKESKQHVTEVKEFQRVLHHDRKVHNFLHDKNQGRAVIEEDDERRLRKEHAKECELDQILSQHHATVNTILKMAASNSVDKLCEKYGEMEQRNLALFKFLTDLNHECAALREAVSVLKQGIESTHHTITLRKNNQQERLKRIQNKVIEEENALRNMNIISDSNFTKLSQLVSAVESLFTVAKCPDAGLVGILGNQNGVTPRNAVLCLTILDHRITELQYVKKLLEHQKLIGAEGSQKGFGHKSMFGQGLGTAIVNHGGPFKAEVLIPNHIGGEGEEEDADKAMGERPYFFDEMKEFVVYQMIEQGLIELSEVPSSIRSTISAVSAVSIADMEIAGSASLMEKVMSKRNFRMGSQQIFQQNIPPEPEEENDPGDIPPDTPRSNNSL